MARPIVALGAELQALSQGTGAAVLGSGTPARVAMVFSWPNWWNMEYTPGPSNRIDYLEEVLR